MIKSYYFDKTILPTLEMKRMIESIKGFHIKINSLDYRRFMKVCCKNNNSIEAVSLRKHCTPNGLYFFIMIEFYFEITYSEIFEKYFSVLKENFEIIKLENKWQHRTQEK